MDTSRLPLLELFTSLREAGLPLGLGEYELLLQALQGEFGVADEAALKRLCQTLWVKSAAEQGIFDYQFERVMEEAFASAAARSARPELGPRTPASRKREKSKTPSESRSRGSETLTQIQVLGKRWPWLLAGSLVLSGIGGGIWIWRERSPFLSANPPDTAQVNLPTTPTQQPLDLIATLVSLGVLVSGSGAAFGIKRLRQRLEQQQIQQVVTQTKPQIAPELTQSIDDEIQAAQTVNKSLLRSALSSQLTLISQQVLAEDYLPIKQRQMKQCWRYLRLNRREGASTEMDVDATIRQIGRRGRFLDLVMVPRRVNRMELLLLVDQGGSMVPFHGLSRRLIETAVGAGRLGRSGVFYFRNFPGRSLYHDPYQVEAVKTDRVLGQCLPRWTTVMIVSDGGALRGGYNSRRLLRTVAFLEQLQEGVRSLVWLNPMPQERWAGTTAEGIAQQVPMVEMSREGMMGAIGILRGQEVMHEL